MDFFAIASVGTYPTPTPSDAERAASVVTWGLFLGPLASTTVNTLVKLREVILNEVILNPVELNEVFMP